MLLFIQAKKKYNNPNNAILYTIIFNIRIHKCIIIVTYIHYLLQSMSLMRANQTCPE